MLRAIKRMLQASQADARVAPAHERRQLQVAVAVLLHEARRADYVEAGEESSEALRALGEIFHLGERESAELLQEGGVRAGQLSSFFAPVSIVKREFSPEQRIHLVEHLWRVSFADGHLDYYEDHYVRKIAHLLYVPNTQSMLARNRARR
ncbi:MAG TPA: TerB family tellurite resistance protein [Burkholderiales bacterium]|nr:TerB family tellurite resistance protein [Burkholderiales bacterium]